MDLWGNAGEWVWPDETEVVKLTAPQQWVGGSWQDGVADLTTERRPMGPDSRPSAFGSPEDW